MRKYDKILNKAKKLLNTVVDKDSVSFSLNQNFSTKNQFEIQEKINNLNKFVFDNSNKKEHVNIAKECQEKFENHQKIGKIIQEK